MNIHTEQFFDWPYDEALLWMANAAKAVKASPEKILIALGSHKEQVITLGRNPLKNTLDASFLPKSVLVRQIERGGGITAHEPGQLVLYPVLNIEHHKISITFLIDILLKTLLSLLAELQINATSDNQGIYIGKQKIGFLGLRVKEGITSHGISLNLFNEAKIFSWFDPCGIEGLQITSARSHVALPHSLPFYAWLLERQIKKRLKGSGCADV